MKLLAYIFKEEPRFDVNDCYRVNITKEKLASVKATNTKYELEKIEELIDEGDLPIPGEYFNKGVPFLFVIDTGEKETCVMTEKALTEFMFGNSVTRIYNSNKSMYVEIKDGQLCVHGVDVALSSTSRSDYLYIRSKEKESCRIYTGLDLNLASGKVKLYGRSFGYVLEPNPKFTKIINIMNNQGKSYVTKITYTYVPNDPFRIEVSSNVVETLDTIKNEVYKKDREVFGTLYSKVKSGIPLDTDYEIDNPIYSITLVTDGKEETILSKDLNSQYYTDIHGKTCIVKINGKYSVVEDYDKSVLKINYKYRPISYKEIELESKDSFIVETSNKTGIRCRIAGKCKVPLDYEEIT